jgi:hypothetical protein
MATHARLLDRRRFELMLGHTDVSAVLAAVDGYRNPDGGYGWGLEHDLRAPESQPGGALHALEVFEEIAPTTSPHAAQLCDWLQSVSLPDGGMPFALPLRDPAGCAPFWAEADPNTAALQSTAFVTGTALRVADPAVAAHPWLARAVSFCFKAIEQIETAPHAIELCFAIQFLDAAHDKHPQTAATLLDHLRQFVPESGLVPVAGGSEGETLRALSFAPRPGRPARELFPPDVIEAELARVAAQQLEDGGWVVDFASFSPAAALEWRGYATVGAISMLRQNQLI